MPSCLTADGSVRAARIRKPADFACEQYSFSPLTTQFPSARLTAVVRSDAASDPEPGSVRPSAMKTSPAITLGSTRSFCAWVPNLATSGARITAARPQAVVIADEARANCSTKASMPIGSGFSSPL